jgi:hypothetical protein
MCTQAMQQSVNWAPTAGVQAAVENWNGAATARFLRVPLLERAAGCELARSTL